MSANRLAASDRMARLLAVIPWVTAQDRVPLDEISTRFDYPRDKLEADLREVVFFVGVHPFTPDTLIDVEISDGMVSIRYADWFSRPMRLTPDEGARLLTAGRSVLELTASGDDEDAGPLLRAIAKLSVALGDGAEDAVDVRLGDAPEDTLDHIRRAIAEGRALHLGYYSYGRDEFTERDVDPGRLFSDQGRWYLSGWCHLADGERVFRVDRIREAEVLDREPTHPPTDTADSSFTPDDDDPRIVLRLSPEHRWVIEQYPVELIEETDDHIEIRLVVTALPWLERLLLRLGPGAEIASAGETIDPELRAAAARRVLERYRTPAPPGGGH